MINFGLMYLPGTIRGGVGRFLFAWIAAAVAGNFPVGARAYCRTTTITAAPGRPACPQCTSGQPNCEPGIPIEWRKPCISYALNDRGSLTLPTPALREVMAQAFGTWEEVECNGQLTGVQTLQLNRMAECDIARYCTERKTCSGAGCTCEGSGNANIVAFIEEGWDERYPLRSSALAVTTTWFSKATGEIFDADMEFNEECFQFGVCPPEGCGPEQQVAREVPAYCLGSLCPTASCSRSEVADLLNVATHEAGHFFGLAHAPNDQDATMYAFTGQGSTKARSLSPDDIAGFCDIYGESDFRTCDFSPRGGLSLRCSGEPEVDLGCSPSAGMLQGTARSSVPAPPIPWVLAVGWLTWRRRQRRTQGVRS